MVSPRDRLLAVEEIRNLKARYFRDLDTKDWQDLPSIFATDAEFDLRAVNSVRELATGELRPPLGGDEQIFRGRTAIVAMIRGAIEGPHTIHLGHTPEIKILSPTSARGIWVLEDTLRKPTGELVLRGFGHYYEVYEKLENSWKIKKSRLSRLWMDGGALNVPLAEHGHEALR